MPKSTTYETAFKIGCKFTGASEIRKANAGIDSIERNLKGLGSAMTRARRHFFDFGKVAAGAFAGFTAANVLGAAARGIKDITLAAFNAADEVVKLREGNKRLLMSFGMTNKQAAETEKRLYGVATAMEKGVGHDAEIMSKVLAGMRKSLSDEEIEANRVALSGYFTAISEGVPTIEKGAQAYEELNNLFMKGKGPALSLMKWDKEKIKIFQSLNYAQRKYWGLQRLNQLFGHQAAEFFASDTGKMNYAMTLFGNRLEDLGEAAVGNKGKLADLLISIATQLEPISKHVGKIAGAKLAQWLKDVNDQMPAHIEHLRQQGANLENVWTVVTKIHGVLVTIENLQFTVLFKLLDILLHPIDNLEKLINLMQKVGEPAKLPQLPGAPSQEPIPGGAGTGGEAARRAEAGRALMEAGAKAAEEGAKTGAGGGWGTPMNPRISSLPAIGPVPSGGLGGLLTGKEKAFEEAAKRHGVDPLLLMAMAKFETGSGTSKMLREKKNVAGITDPKTGAYMAYASIEEGIEAQAKLIASYNRRGLKTISQIGNRWAPAGAWNDPGGTNASWPANVSKNYQAMQKQAEAQAQRKVPVSEDVIPLLQEGAAAYPLGEPLIPDSAYMKDPRRQGINRLTRDVNASERTSGVGGGTNVAMTSGPITINGVPAGREGAVGREVARALQDPDRLLLAELRSAKASEQRLTYDV